MLEHVNVNFNRVVSVCCDSVELVVVKQRKNLFPLYHCPIVLVKFLLSSDNFRNDPVAIK